VLLTCLLLFLTERGINKGFRQKGRLKQVSKTGSAKAKATLIELSTRANSTSWDLPFMSTAKNFNAGDDQKYLEDGLA